MAWFVLSVVKSKFRLDEFRLDDVSKSLSIILNVLRSNKTRLETRISLKSMKMYYNHVLLNHFNIWENATELDMLYQLKDVALHLNTQTFVLNLVEDKQIKSVKC